MFTTQILGAVAADLFYKSVPGLCLIISRAARYLPKLALNNIPSLCVYYDLYEVNVARKEYKSRSDQSERGEQKIMILKFFLL